MKKQFLFPELRVISMDIIETQAGANVNTSATGDGMSAPGRAGVAAPGAHAVTDFD